MILGHGQTAPLGVCAVIDGRGALHTVFDAELNDGLLAETIWFPLENGNSCEGGGRPVWIERHDVCELNASL